MIKPDLTSYLRNRNIAHIILAAAAVLLLFCLGLELAGWRNSYLAFIGFLAEAMLVASVADFIAITAISHELPIPGMRRSTGLIGKKREVIIQSLTGAFRDSLLPKESLLRIIQQANLVSLLQKLQSCSLMDKRGDFIARSLAALLRENQHTLSHFLAGALINYLATVDPGKIIKLLHQTARAKGWLRELLTQLFVQLEETVAAPEFRPWLEQEIGQAIEKQASNPLFSLFLGALKFSDTLNYADIAADVQNTLRHELARLTSQNRDADREAAWQEMEHFFSQLIISLSHNRQVTEELNAWKSRVFTAEDLTPRLSHLLDIAIRWLESGSLTASQAVADLGISLTLASDVQFDLHQWLAGQLERGIQRLLQNEIYVKKRMLELAELFLDNEYEDAIGLVQSILQQLSNDDLILLVNGVAGGHLQWLRISGAIVGGCTGALLLLVIWWPAVFLPVFTLATLALIFIPSLRRRLVSYRS